MTDFHFAGVPRKGAYRSVESSQMRRQFSETVDEARLGARRIMITRHGRPIAALVSVRDFEKLRQLDAETDRRMMAARPERSGTSIPFADFAADLLEEEGEPAEAILEEADLSLGQVAAAVAEQFAAEPDSAIATKVARFVLRRLRSRYGPGYRFTPDEASEAIGGALELLRESAVERREEAAA